jgi:DNA-binding NtrC family response regulator/tetratricopeptide (TPR) repeat protein
MKESATYAIEMAEKLLREHKFRASLQVLGEIDLDSVSPDEKANAYLIIIEANIAAGNYEISDYLQKVLDYYRQKNETRMLARAKYLHARYLISLGRYFDAKEQLLESNLTFRSFGDIAWQARALNRLGFISHQNGEFNSAINYLRQCIEIYDRGKDIKNRSVASMNLARLFISLGYLDKAMSLSADIHDHILSKGSQNISVYYMIFAFPHALKGDFSVAQQTIEKALDYLSDHSREQAIYFEYMGWIHNLEGEYEEALKVLHQGLDISLKIAPESALVSQTKRLMADAYVGLDEFETAKLFAGQALAVAEKLNERVEIAACHRVFAQVDAFAGDTDAAREWFRKATELFSMIGSRYELAVTRYLAAISGYYLNGERQALLYLAREYFESENVEHYVARINRELTETPLSRSRPAHVNGGLPTIICRDPSMIRLVELAQHIAPSNLSVLLTGPTGCGKDLFARFIHYHSGREGRFVSVNAAAIPDNMVESELFGYRKGAYTGASATTSGWIEEADGGTFYLNEIADSSPELQAKLLDVIENRRICRLGERQEREVDCRIIAATNHDLEKLVIDGRFRLDLFHRLNEIPIHLPSLSERGGDIGYLLEHFMKSAGVEIKTKADKAAFDRLASIFTMRPWPGNVRELEIQVKRLTLLSRGDIARMVDAAISELPSKKDETRAALDRTGWNRREAARALGISESTVRHRIKIFNLTPDNQ